MEEARIQVSTTCWMEASNHTTQMNLFLALHHLCGLSLVFEWSFAKKNRVLDRVCTYIYYVFLVVFLLVLFFHIWMVYMNFNHFILFTNSIFLLREIIVYSRSTINMCSLLLHKLWVSLIKFMVGPTIHVRGESTHLWYSEST